MHIRFNNTSAAITALSLCALLVACGESKKDKQALASTGVAITPPPASVPDAHKTALEASKKSTRQTDWDVDGLFGPVSKTSTTWLGGDYEERYYDTDGSLLRRVTGNEAREECNNFIYENHSLLTINLQHGSKQQYFRCVTDATDPAHTVIHKIGLDSIAHPYADLYYDSQHRLVRAVYDGRTTTYLYTGSSFITLPPAGSKVTRTDSQNNWLRITLPGGRKGKRRIEYF